MRPQEILTTYLAQINVVRSTGQANPEVSYCPALAGLLNAVGAAMKPRVHCVINLDPNSTLPRVSNHSVSVHDAGESPTRPARDHDIRSSLYDRSVNSRLPKLPTLPA